MKLYLSCCHELLPEFRCLSCSSNLHVWLSTYALLFHYCSEYDLCCGRVLIGLALQCVCALVCVCVRVCTSTQMFAYVYVSMLTAWAVSRTLSAAPTHVALLQSEWLLSLCLTCALWLPIPVQPCSAPSVVDRASLRGPLVTVTEVIALGTFYFF